jgi:NAD(P)-dependent dehydrogenase (short-subunit alcohol dehydrogenase family)
VVRGTSVDPYPNKLVLHDKVVIVTGAGSGIGRETAILFAEAGAIVVIADISITGFETASLIGKQARFLQTDVADWSDSKRLVDSTINECGRLDILFNNAGIDLPQATTVIDTNEEDWDRILSVNTTGVFNCSHHALSVMVQRRSGVIINNASRAGLAATFGEAAYCASKAAVISLTRQMAFDYASYNIRVNCICPGVMEKPTEDRREFLEAKAVDGIQDRYDRYITENPLGRLCTPLDVAKAALYLGSDKSSHVTGIALQVDGGELLL